MTPATHRPARKVRTPDGATAHLPAVDLLDATIAARLGQSGGARLIETIYGAPTDSFGDGRFDFLPSPESQVPSAWTLLTAPITNIIAL